jgi:hypothetical protein
MPRRGSLIIFKKAANGLKIPKLTKFDRRASNGHMMGVIKKASWTKLFTIGGVSLNRVQRTPTIKTTKKPAIKFNRSPIGAKRKLVFKWGG